MKKLLIGCLLVAILFFPASVGWKAPDFPPYTIGKTVESPTYVKFWTKQRRHGWDTISYEKEDGKFYFMRNGVECKF